VIVYVEADEPPDSLPASSPAATAVCEGAATAAVYESLAASGRNNLVVGSSSSRWRQSLDCRWYPQMSYKYQLCRLLSCHICVACVRTHNLNAVVNARFSWVRCVDGGGNLRERSAVACFIRPGFDFGLRGDRGGGTVRSRLSLSSSSSKALAVDS